MEPRVIYEDSDVLVLDKPAGLNVHGDGRTVEPTLSEWVLKNYPDLALVGEPFLPFPQGVLRRAPSDKVPSRDDMTTPAPIARPGIVHRLDRDTSGVIILAKTKESFDYLKAQFKEHKVKKEYIALVYGHLDTPSGVIDAPIGKSKKDFRQRDASPLAGGALREARTIWELKERLVDKEGHTYSLLYVRPETGRTHQIRAHMKFLGHPITCDSLYARGRICIPPLTRHSLHAAKLSLELPSGEARSFESPLPADFQSALEQLRPL